MRKERKDKHFIKKPVYPGGLKAMRQFIKENMQYPKEALEAKVEGTVKLKYSINHLGKVIDSKVLHGIGYGCDEEARRLAGLLRFEVPKNRKLRILFHKDLQVHFRLPKKVEKQIESRVQYNISFTEGKKDQLQKKKPGYSYSITIGGQGKNE